MVVGKSEPLAYPNPEGCDGVNNVQLIARQQLSIARIPALFNREGVARVLRVLIVDDDHDTADMLDMLVRHWGHRSCPAYNGLTAVKSALAMRPDVVLLDVEMPVQGGYEVSRLLRTHFPKDDCLIVAITGRADSERRSSCSAAGIDLVLLKPVDPTVIETLLMLELARVNGTSPVGAAIASALQLPPTTCVTEAVVTARSFIPGVFPC